MLLGKNKLWGPEKIKCYTTLVALFEICFRFLTLKKEDNAVKLRIPWDLVSQICSREMLLDCIAMGISWWLTSNRMGARAINNKFDSW